MFEVGERVKFIGRDDYEHWSVIDCPLIAGEIYTIRRISGDDEAQEGSSGPVNPDIAPWFWLEEHREGFYGFPADMPEYALEVHPVWPHVWFRKLPKIDDGMAKLTALFKTQEQPLELA